MVDFSLKEKALIAVAVAVILIVAYLEVTQCGGFNGTVADVPRWCWWLR